MCDTSTTNYFNSTTPPLKKTQQIYRNQDCENMNSLSEPTAKRSLEQTFTLGGEPSTSTQYHDPNIGGEDITIEEWRSTENKKQKSFLENIGAKHTMLYPEKKKFPEPPHPLAKKDTSIKKPGLISSFKISKEKISLKKKSSPKPNTLFKFLSPTQQPQEDKPMNTPELNRIADSLCSSSSTTPAMSQEDKHMEEPDASQEDENAAILPLKQLPELSNDDTYSRTVHNNIEVLFRAHEIIQYENDEPRMKQHLLELGTRIPLLNNIFNATAARHEDVNSEEYWNDLCKTITQELQLTDNADLPTDDDNKTVVFIINHAYTNLKETEGTQYLNEIFSCSSYIRNMLDKRYEDFNRLPTAAEWNKLVKTINDITEPKTTEEIQPVEEQIQINDTFHGNKTSTHLLEEKPILNSYNNHTKNEKELATRAVEILSTGNNDRNREALQNLMNTNDTFENMIKILCNEADPDEPTTWDILLPHLQDIAKAKNKVLPNLVTDAYSLITKINEIRADDEPKLSLLNDILYTNLSLRKLLKVTHDKQSSPPNAEDWVCNLQLLNRKFAAVKTAPQAFHHPTHPAPPRKENSQSQIGKSSTLPTTQDTHLHHHHQQQTTSTPTGVPATSNTSQTKERSEGSGPSIPTAQNTDTTQASTKGSFTAVQNSTGSSASATPSGSTTPTTEDTRLNKLLGTLASFTSANTNDTDKVTKLNTLINKNPQLKPFVEEWLDDDQHFKYSTDWTTATTEIKNKQAEHTKKMKEGPTTSAPKIKTEKLQKEAPPATLTNAARIILTDYNKTYYSYKKKMLPNKDWNDVWNIDEKELDEWSLDEELFKPFSLDKQDMPYQIFGLPPGTSRTEIVSALGDINLTIEEEDIQIYMIKNKATEYATQTAAVCLPFTKEVSDILTFKKPLLIGDQETGLRLDQQLTKPLEARFYDKDDGASTNRYLSFLAIRKAKNWSEYRATKFTTKELRAEDINVVGVRWDGYTWSTNSSTGKRQTDTQIDYAHPKAGLFGLFSTTMERKTALITTNSNPHYFPSIINFKNNGIRFHLKLWISPMDQAKKSENADNTDLRIPDGAEPNEVVIVYGAPENARAIFERNHPLASTPGAKQKTILQEYLMDEATKVLLDTNTDTGSINWGGNHIIVAKSPEYAQDIHNRIMIRANTNEKMKEQHRIDFFMNNTMYSNMKSTLYTDLVGGNWEEPKKPKKTFDYSNPNAPKQTPTAEPDTQVNDQLATLQAQVEELTRKLAEHTPTAEAEAGATVV